MEIHSLRKYKKNKGNLTVRNNLSTGKGSNKEKTKQDKKETTEQKASLNVLF